MRTSLSKSNDQLPENTAGSVFPTSRFYPVVLERPLSVFGKSFRVELSSGLTLGPDTVLRAAIGKSLQTVLRDSGHLLQIKEMSYGLRRIHRLSPTTIATILCAMGPMANMFDKALNGTNFPQEIIEQSDWTLLASTLLPLPEGNSIGVLVQNFLTFDKICESVNRLVADGNRAEAERLFVDELGDMVPIWKSLCPDVRLEGCIRIETSLRAVAALEAASGKDRSSSERTEQIVLGLLASASKPIGNWLKQVATMARCRNNREFADLLFQKKILHHKKQVTHDTIKGWSSMKPGMLMTLGACDSVLKSIEPKIKSDYLRSRFALARFLAFQVDFLRSSVRGDVIPWAKAQDVIEARYRMLRNDGGELIPD